MLTYESATSLNIFLSGGAVHGSSARRMSISTSAGAGAGGTRGSATLRPPGGGSFVEQQSRQRQSSALVKAIKDGVGVDEGTFVFALTVEGYVDGCGVDEEGG